MNREEKEEYFISTCEEYKLFKNTKEFREKVSNMSDKKLDTEIGLILILIAIKS